MWRNKNNTCLNEFIAHLKLEIDFFRINHIVGYKTLYKNIG